jgi:hypothetical protein
VCVIADSWGRRGLPAWLFVYPSFNHPHPHSLPPNPSLYKQTHTHTTDTQDTPKGQTIVGIPARAIGMDRKATYVDTNAEAIRSVVRFRCWHKRVGD